MASGPVIVHNAGEPFRLPGARVLRQKLEPTEIAAALR
jgi:hypothetical protein